MIDDRDAASSSFVIRHWSGDGNDQKQETIGFHQQ